LPYVLETHDVADEARVGDRVLLPQHNEDFFAVGHPVAGDGLEDGFAQSVAGVEEVALYTAGCQE
jgi:hypothetical protein